MTIEVVIVSAARSAVARGKKDGSLASVHPVDLSATVMRAVADRVQGGKYIEIIPDREKIARYGIDLATVQTVIQTVLGGMQLDEAVEGRERYPIMLRYDRPYREHVDDLDDVLIPTSLGAYIPLASIADIRIAEGPAMITSEDARLNGWVFVLSLIHISEPTRPY